MSEGLGIAGCALQKKSLSCVATSFRPKIEKNLHLHCFQWVTMVGFVNTNLETYPNQITIL